MRPARFRCPSRICSALVVVAGALLGSSFLFPGPNMNVQDGPMLRTHPGYRGYGTPLTAAATASQSQIESRTHAQGSEGEGYTASRCFPEKRFLTPGERNTVTGRPYPRTLLLSFPGSGNTWMRALIEETTGVWTGILDSDHGGALTPDADLLALGFIGDGQADVRRVVVAKSHVLTRAAISHFDQVLFLVRNPFDALVAEHKRRVLATAGPAFEHLNPHTDSPPWSRFLQGYPVEGIHANGSVYRSWVSWGQVVRHSTRPRNWALLVQAAQHARAGTTMHSNSTAASASGSANASASHASRLSSIPVHTVRFEELKADPVTTMQGVLRFLERDPAAGRCIIRNPRFWTAARRSSGSRSIESTAAAAPPSVNTSLPSVYPACVYFPSWLQHLTAQFGQELAEFNYTVPSACKH